jgi:hypothetical protein
MSTNDDIGIIQVVLKRFNNIYLPRASSLKEQVDAGGRLSEQDIQFLAGVFEHANEILAVVDRHPEYQGLAAQAISLYQHITEKALENEKLGN